MSPLISQAVSILRAGGLIGLPTETVYGLAADAKNPTAIAKVFAAKGRPVDHPLIVHIGTLSELSEWARDIPIEAYQLARYFWPGPLTLILKKQPSVSTLLTGGQDTVALRIPDHPLTLELLRTFKGAVVAPSANQFGRISPTTKEAVLAELGNKVDLVLPGGRTYIGIESTIIDLHQKPFTLLRPGMITQEEIESLLGHTINLPTAHTSTRAPGLLPSHYAPHTPLFLAEDMKGLEALLSSTLKKNIIVLTHSKLSAPPSSNTKNITWHTMPANPKDYAHELYAALREADEAHPELIIVEAPPKNPTWTAIHDRLQRAAKK